MTGFFKDLYTFSVSRKYPDENNPEKGFFRAVFNAKVQNDKLAIKKADKIFDIRVRHTKATQSLSGVLKFNDRIVKQYQVVITEQSSVYEGMLMEK